MRVRLVSYNIMTGGEGRADPIAEVLLGKRPDVVGIHEADDDAVLRRLRDRLRMDFVVGDGAGGRLAVFSRFQIMDSANLSLVHHSTMPILDVTLGVGRVELPIRAAFVRHAGEAQRMAGRLATNVPVVMLMSYDAPVGMRVVDGEVVRSDQPMPARSHVPPRQLDQVLVRREVQVIETWVEQDRLAYYASDHLPAGAEIEVA